MEKAIKTFEKDQLKVKIYKNTEEMGECSAVFVKEKIDAAIAEKGSANLILATGTSQFAFIEALKKKDIDWKKVNVFHLDEYVGISETHPASFRKYLKERILNIVKPANAYLIEGDAKDVDEVLNNYENLLKNHPIDIACIGIGENGHIAFNDPPVADFNDPKLIKVVELDEDCRKQQLGEGWFPTLEDVPGKAFSLTITAIMNCKAISCVVPDERKAKAVNNTINGPIAVSCPASILRKHPNTVLFLDNASGAAFI